MVKQRPRLTGNAQEKFMFYDESARSESSKSQSRLKLFRFTMTGVIIVLLLPFVMLAFGPVMLMLFPLALTLIPLMIPGLFSGAHVNQLEPAVIRAPRLEAWRPAPSVPR